MNSLAAALSLLFLFSAPLVAGGPEQKQENASARLVLTRPGEGGVFANSLRGLRRQAEDAPPFEWKEIDERIDTWFAAAESRFPEEHKKHAGNWDELREQSKRDARVTLAPVERAWKNSVLKAAAAFETSEAGFYALRPTILIRGTYRYHEGQREISNAKPAWKLANATWTNIGRIHGGDVHDSGETVLKAAGMDLPMFSLRCVWDVSLEASIDPLPLKAQPIGSINTPVIRAWIDPSFIGKSNRKVTLTWRNHDKTNTRIGPLKMGIGDSQITITSGSGEDFRFEALASNSPKPELRAGDSATAVDDIK